jgi:hypothetical protein
MTDEIYFGFSILWTKIADGNPDTGEGEQEVYALFSAEISSLPRCQLAQFIQLGCEQEFGLFVEFLAGESDAEQDIVPVFDGKSV